jgi:predicted alpha/beta-fold hydrolase
MLTDRGGHLGFVARAGGDADSRWMDWRVVEWVCGK